MPQKSRWRCVRYHACACVLGAMGTYQLPGERNWNVLCSASFNKLRLTRMLDHQTLGRPSPAILESLPTRLEGCNHGTLQRTQLSLKESLAQTRKQRQR